MIQIMKNKNLILSVLFWVVSICAFAVQLPASPFETTSMSYDAASENITIGSGTKYTQVYLTSGTTEYADACYGVFPDDEDSCIECCEDYEDACPAGDLDCYDKVRICKTTCHEGPSLPLGSPLLLLPFALVYGVLRRRKEA